VSTIGFQALKENSEQRRSARFATDGCTLVSLGDDARLGEVLNVSLGGLAYRCIVGEEPTTPSGELNVYCNHGLCLVKLPFKAIWNLEVSDSPPFDYITTKRSGLRFEDLTDEQSASLYSFIQNHTTADPEG
jgi:hypothetical protein